MAQRMLALKNRKLTWCPTILDVSAPKVTELNAGIDLQWLISANNFSLGVSDEEEISDPPLASGQNVSAPGRTTVTAEMDFFRFLDVDDDEAWTTFANADIHGYLVQRKGASEADDYAADDVVEVYEMLTGSPMPQTPDNNGTGYEKFRLKFHPQDEFDDRAVVVTGS